MFDFSQYVSTTPANTKVLTSHSEKVKGTESRDKHLEQDGSYHNKLTAFGVSQNLDKEDRKFHMKLALDNGRISTIKEAMDLVSVSENTIKKYLKELGYVYDKEGNIGGD